MAVLALCHAASPAIAHISPEHTGQQKTGRHRLALAHAAVGVLQGRIHQRLAGALDHQVQQRVDPARQAQRLKLGDTGQRMAGLQQLEHFVKQPALGHIGQQGTHGHQGFGRLGLQLEAQGAELGRETHGTDDAHRVFPVARGRVADHAQQTLLCVLQAPVVVDHDLGGRVVVHGIDGEITPRGVLVLRAPYVVTQHATTGVHRMLHAGQLALAGALVAGHLLGCRVVHVGTEGGNLDHLMFTAAAINHMDDSETSPDDEGTAKQTLDLLGRGIGGHIEILGPQAQQQVAHRAADDVGLKARLLQTLHHVQRPVIHQRRVDPVGCRRDLHPLAEAGALAPGLRGGRLAQQLVDEFLDHVLSWLCVPISNAVR